RAACGYPAVVGKQGLRRVAELCFHKAHYAAKLIEQIPGYSVNNFLPFFQEFIVTCPRPVKDINAALYDDFNIIGGYDLSKDYPDRANQMLVAETETNTKSEIDDLVRGLAPASGE